VKATAKLTLFSISPDGDEDDSRPGSVERFHGYPILGQVVIKEDVKKTVVKELKSGIVEKTSAAKASSGDVYVLPSCWEPRHGLRFEDDGAMIDLVICFHCESMHVYGLSTRRTRLTNDSPQAHLNKILVQAGVPLAPTRHQE
jgi:hypothetical protein